METYYGILRWIRRIAALVCSLHRRWQRKVNIERELPCEVEDITACLMAFPHAIERVGFEVGALSQHLYFGLQAEGFDIVCMEARQVSAALSGWFGQFSVHNT
jgi:transposase